MQIITPGARLIPRQCLPTTLPCSARYPETPSHADTSLHRVVIVGGGAGGLELATRLGRKFGKRRLSVTLVDRNRTHIWKPLLHEVASGALNASSDDASNTSPMPAGTTIDTASARSSASTAPNARSLSRPASTMTAGRSSHRVCWATTRLSWPSAASATISARQVQRVNAIALDTAEQAARFNKRMIDACLRANAQYEQLSPGQLHCVIVGAGATGVELAAELHKSMREIASHNLDNIDFERLIRITIVEAGPRILPALPEHLARASARLLVDLGVQIRCGIRVTEVTKDGVRLGEKLFVPAELVVWSAGIKAPDFLKRLDGLETDRINRLVVDETLRAKGDENVFAIGDCANCVLPGQDNPLPPRAQTAHQQADHLVKVVARASRRAGRAGIPLPRLRLARLLADYGTFGSLIGGLKIEGLLARLMYRSLYKMHLKAVHGTFKTVLDTTIGFLSRRAKPRVKLH